MTLQASRISGSFVYPVVNGDRQDSTVDEMIGAIQKLEGKKQEWAEKTIEQRLGFLETMVQDFASLAPEWVEKVSAAQHITGNDHAIGAEWMQGPYSVLRNLQNLRQSLREICSASFPNIPGAVTLRRNGQISVQVFPQTMYDRILFNGYRAEVWMEEGVTLENLRQTQATAYADGGVTNNPNHFELEMNCGDTTVLITVPMIMSNGGQVDDGRIAHIRTHYIDFGDGNGPQLVGSWGGRGNQTVWCTWIWPEESPYYDPLLHGMDIQFSPAK